MQCVGTILFSTPAHHTKDTIQLLAAAASENAAVPICGIAVALQSTGLPESDRQWGV